MSFYQTELVVDYHRSAADGENSSNHRDHLRAEQKCEEDKNRSCGDGKDKGECQVGDVD